MRRHVRRSRTAAIAALSFGVWAAPAAAEPVADCGQGRDQAARLKACTDVINGKGYSQEQRAVAFRHRGNARSDAGAAADAIGDFTDAIRLNPKDAASHSGRAQARLTRGDVDGAIADFTAALEMNPAAASSSGYLIGRGYGYLVKGDADRAVADFTEAIRLNPRSASALNNRGLAWRKKGDDDRAIEDYTAAIAINPIYAVAYTNRGHAHESKGRREDAIADFSRALLLDPSQVGAAEAMKRLGAPGDQALVNATLVREGKTLVEANCVKCHAVGPSGASPNPKAPEFRTLYRRHPVLALREPLSRGIAAPHDEMPNFKLSNAEVDKIVAYINSLQVPQTR